MGGKNQTSNIPSTHDISLTTEQLAQARSYDIDIFQDVHVDECASRIIHDDEEAMPVRELAQSCKVG
jgi:hypothetical protein